MKRVCDDCGGSGERETTDYCEECPSCFGSGELPSVALVRLIGMDGPLVTEGYVQQLRFIAEGFQFGWGAARLQQGDRYDGGGCGYTDVRDFLLYEVEADFLTACRIALYLTRQSDDMFFLTFGGGFV